MINRLLSLATLLVAFVPANVPADSWSYPTEISHEVFEFGSVRFVLTTDATENQTWPDFTLRMLRDDVLVAQYKGIAFDDLFPSPENSAFVGLSNDGLPGTAIVVIGKSGELNFHVSHRHADFDYCSKSATRVRIWYDVESPDVQFHTEGTKESYSGISVRDCHGKRVDLWETAAKAYNTALEATR